MKYSRTKPPKKRASRAAFVVEQLERRDLPAGVVSVFLNTSSRTLFLTDNNDRFGNGVQILANGSNYVISGLFAGGSSTRISGTTSIPIRSVSSIVVNFAGGDDVVRARGGLFPGMQITTGFGNDRVELQTVTIVSSGLLTVTTGPVSSLTPDQDEVNLRGVTFAADYTFGAHSIKTGADRDRVVLDSVFCKTGKMDINLGSGVDQTLIVAEFHSAIFSILRLEDRSPAISLKGKISRFWSG